MNHCKHVEGFSRSRVVQNWLETGLVYSISTLSVLLFHTSCKVVFFNRLLHRFTILLVAPTLPLSAQLDTSLHHTDNNRY